MPGAGGEEMEYVYQLSVAQHGLGLAVDDGCVVIEAGVDAAAAGICVGSRIATINGCAIADRSQLFAVLGTLQDGTTIMAGLQPSARLVRLVFAKRHVMDSSIVTTQVPPPPTSSITTTA